MDRRIVDEADRLDAVIEKIKQIMTGPAIGVCQHASIEMSRFLAKIV